MTDAMTFERALAEAFDRYLEAAPVEIDAVALSRSIVARRPAVRTTGRWSIPSWRLLIVAGLLALTVGLVVVASGLLIPRPVVVVPSASDASPATSALAASSESPSPTLSPRPFSTPPAGVGAWEMVELRPQADQNFLDVVATRPTGEQRLVRSIDRRLPGLDFPLSEFGSISQTGWLAVGGSDPTPSLPMNAYALYNLADPVNPPLVLRYPAVIAGQWSPNGLFALSSDQHHTATSWMEIDVVDPATGSRNHLGQIGLFGGGPSIVWATDGSGLLSGTEIARLDHTRASVGPGMLFTDRRVGPGRQVVDWTGPVTVQDITGATTTWFTGNSVVGNPTSALFSADGRSLLVALDRFENGHHTAVVGRLTSPGGAFSELFQVQLPAGGFGPTIEPNLDDTAYLLRYGMGASDQPAGRIAPIQELDLGSLRPPSGSFVGWVPIALAESWPSLREYEHIYGHEQDFLDGTWVRADQPELTFTIADGRAVIRQPTGILFDEQLVAGGGTLRVQDSTCSPLAGDYVYRMGPTGTTLTLMQGDGCQPRSAAFAGAWTLASVP